MTDRLVPSKKEGQDLIESWEGGGGGTPLFKPYRYMPPQRVGFLGLFGLKKYTLPILVWNLKELRECMKVLSFQFQIRKKERELCEFEMDLIFFVFALI